MPTALEEGKQEKTSYGKKEEKKEGESKNGGRIKKRENTSRINKTNEETDREEMEVLEECIG